MKTALALAATLAAALPGQAFHKHYYSVPVAPVSGPAFVAPVAAAPLTTVAPLGYYAAPVHASYGYTTAPVGTYASPSLGYTVPTFATAPTFGYTYAAQLPTVAPLAPVAPVAGTNPATLPTVAPLDAPTMARMMAAAAGPTVNDGKLADIYQLLLAIAKKQGVSVPAPTTFAPVPVSPQSMRNIESTRKILDEVAAAQSKWNNDLAGK